MRALHTLERELHAISHGLLEIKVPSAMREDVRKLLASKKGALFKSQMLWRVLE